MIINTIQRYYRLTKPGIIYGNLLTALGGFFLGSTSQLQPLKLISMALGLSLVIASGCVINNVLDRRIDKKMARTRQRALVIGTIHPTQALWFSAVLGIGGVVVLLLGTTLLALGTAVLGWIVYVGVYSPLKRRSVHSTLAGSIAGAAPPVVGYTAATGRLDVAAWLLFIILVSWQMPHFYAIAIYRLKDYRSASIPVLPLRYSIRAAHIQISLYIVAFLGAVLLLALYGYSGKIYAIIMGLLGLVWLWLALRSFRRTSHPERSARHIFLFSLIVLTSFSILISFHLFLL